MSDAAFRRLTQAEIAVLRYLTSHGAAGRPVTLPLRLREVVVPLWRMRLVEVWYRQVPEDQPSLQGAYYTLSMAGVRRAAPFFRSAAPRSAARASFVPACQPTSSQAGENVDAVLNNQSMVGTSAVHSGDRV
jgi:hypothetical protein